MIEHRLERMIRFRGYSTAATYLSLALAVETKKKASPIGIGVIIMLAIVGIVAVEDEMPPAVTLTAVLIVILVVGGAARQGMAQANAVRRKVYQKAIDSEPREGRIDDEGIHVEFKGGVTDLEWNYFTDLRTVDGAIGLYKDGALAECFSACMFADSAD